MSPLLLCRVKQVAPPRPSVRLKSSCLGKQCRDKQRVSGLGTPGPVAGESNAPKAGAVSHHVHMNVKTPTSPSHPDTSTLAQGPISSGTEFERWFSVTSDQPKRKPAEGDDLWSRQETAHSDRPAVEKPAFLLGSAAKQISSTSSLKDNQTTKGRRTLVSASPCRKGGSQFSSVTQSYLTVCDPMDRSTPGLPVHHQLLQFTQTQPIESVMPSNHLTL